MVKAIIKTKHSQIEIESDKDTIKEIIFSLQRREEFREKFERLRNKREKTSKDKEPENATEMILKVKEEGFFKEKRPLGDIQKELEEKGFIYPITTLSSVMLRLVRKGKLGRIRDKGGWKYVQK